jgi:hypothetical protein
MSKEVNEMHWMDIESVARELSVGNRVISVSDVLQWCSKKNLKVSCHLFNNLARPQHEYCPLLEDGYYQLVARKIFQNEKAKLGAQYKLTDPLSSTGASIKNYDINSLEFLNKLDKSANKQHKKILSKAKEIFERWKTKGGLNTKYGYGKSTLFDGLYTLHVDKELSDWMKRASLGYEVPGIKNLCVISEEDEVFQIVGSNEQRVTFKLKKEDLIVTEGALLAFEKEYLLKTKSPKQRAKKAGAQDGRILIDDRRINDLKKFINELVIFAENKGLEFDPFDMRCSKQMLLVELKRWELEKVPSKKARLWVTKEFPKKVWESKLRRDICFCVSAGGIIDKEYFKNFKL